MESEPSRAWFFFSPSGRVSRRPYALGILFWFSLQFAAIGQMFAGDRQNSDSLLVLSFLALMIVGLASVVSMVMLTIKRVHDMGYPGILAFVVFVPVVSFLALVCFLFWPSAPPNPFGHATNRPNRM